MILGPTIWVEILKFDKPIFPYKYPALFSVLTAFISIVIISLFQRKKTELKNDEKFNIMTIKSFTGK